MKIAHITAGAGHMFCGSCLRDNTMAAALIDAGHDVLLIPTYTPTRSEGRNLSMHRVYLGGINVFLQENVAWFRRAPRFVNRLLDAAPLLRLATRRGVSVEPSHLGRLTVSMLRGTDGTQRRAILELVQFLVDEVGPEIVSIPNSLLIALAPAVKAALKVPVVCTLQGEDLFLDGLGDPYRSQAIGMIREHAAQVDAFVAVSHYGADAMASCLGIDRNRIHVVPLGIDVDGHARAGLDGEVFTIGYLARVAPEKGLDVLCDAYHRLRASPGLPLSRVSAVGYLAPEHRPYLAGIQKRVEGWGLADQFTYHGALDRAEKLAFLQTLSVLSVPAPHAGQKGQFLLEAMASGIPVVQPRSGAFIELVETTGGGILVDPDNPEAVAAGLLDLWRNPDRRRELGAKGYDGVRRHYSAARMVERTMEVYRSVLR
jgi:glycosyltransferase involved in cell wall biosynthesis